MSTVAIHSVPEDLDPAKLVEAGKVLRTLYAALGDDASLSHCVDMIEIAAGSDGWMPIGDDQDSAAARRAGQAANGRLAELGVPIRIAVDMSPEWLIARSAAERRGATPEQVFAADAAEPDGPSEKLVALRSEPQEFSVQAYETAMVLLCQTDGMPLVAAVAAGQLGRTTGQVALYAEVLEALSKVFPWLPGALAEQPPGVAPEAS